MGMFTVKCINPDCGHRVRKGAKFCPKCGTGASKGTIVCGSCGKDVRANSKFCWNCGAELAVAAKPRFDHDRWARQPGDFAIRVDVDDIKGWLLKPLVVEHGTKALVFQAGRFVGEVEDGRYDLGGFMRQLTGFLADQPASIVLLDAGDVTLDLENGGLWTADRFDVGASSRLVVRVQDPDAMFVNLIKGRGRVSLDDLECMFADEVQMLLEAIVSKYSGDRLFPAAEARNEIETQLREHLGKTFARVGIGLAQLRFIDFSGEKYEALRQQQGDLQVGERKADLTTQRAALNQRLRATLTQDKMDAFKNEKDLEEFIRQTEHEIGLKEVIRGDEMQRLKERFHFERDREGVLRRIEVEGIQNDHVRDEAWKQLIAEEREREERHRRALERQKTTQDEEMRQARNGLDLLRQTKDIEHEEDRRKVELEAQALEQRSKATAEALISIVDGPAAQHIVQLEKLRRQENMTPEQILALTAETSPEAARALAKRYEAEGQLSEKMRAQVESQMAEQRGISREHADRMERVMQTALEQMGGVASARARPVESRQTIMTPAGVGAPIVVNPQSSQAGKSCNHCDTALEPGGQFCPACGKKQ